MAVKDDTKTPGLILPTEEEMRAGGSLVQGGPQTGGQVQGVQTGLYTAGPDREVTVTCGIMSVMISCA